MNPLRGGEVAGSDELDRILALPRRDADKSATDELVEQLTELLKTPNGTMKLRPLQALALYEIGIYGGGFCPMPVGSGKTIVSLLAPYMLDSVKPVLLMPAGLCYKTEKERKERYDIHWLVPKNIRLISYEILGRSDWADELESYGPDLLILEEGHKAKNVDAAVTKRILRYLEAHPNTKVVVLSGTLMDHSLLEFAHLLNAALKSNSPVPLIDHEVSAWASALDVKAPRGNEFARWDPGALVRLATGVPGLEHEADDVTRARKGFRNRLVSTPGVISSHGQASSEDCKAPILWKGIVYAPTDENKDPAQKVFKKLRGSMMMTDDHKLITPMEVWSHAREIALGLSYVWDPRAPDEWMEPRKAWCKFIRGALNQSKIHGGELDSPSQVEDAVRQGFLPGGGVLLSAWEAVKDSFKPNTVPVWHDDLALDACAKWAKSSGPGIIWTEHTLFAERLAERTGLKYYGEQGYANDGEYIEEANPKKSVIASADANKEGRNLQKLWSKNLITALEERPGKNEQMIGRTHRSGQEADEVTVDVLVGCLEHLNAFRRLMPAAQAVLDTTGAQQKVLLADVQYWPSDTEVSGWLGARWVPEVKEFEIPI